MQNYEKKIKQKQIEKKVNKRLMEINFFPEGQEEYEQSVDYEVEVMPGYKGSTITFEQTSDSEQISDLEYTCDVPFDVKMKLIEDGIVALINCDYDRSETIIDKGFQTITGIPVREKREEE